MRRLLVCAAVEEELAALLPRLERSGAVWSGSIDGVEIRAAAVGIGPVEAALGTASLLAERPDAALLVGTCGAYPGAGLSVGATVVVETSLLTASDAAAGLSYLPDACGGPARAHPALVAALGAPAAVAVTAVAITRDAARARLLASATGAAVEHMEAFGFLRAAERAAVPAACLLGIANEVGPRAHEEWKARGATAAAAAIERLVGGMGRLRAALG